MQTTPRKSTSNKQINVRASEEERAVIDYAASLVNKIGLISSLRKPYMKPKISFSINVYLSWTMPVIRRSLNS